MNKRGQGLPLNVIVIAIIVVVALVVIVAFFLGGFGQLGGKAGETAGVGLKGTSEALAVASCQRLCAQAKAFSPSQRADSTFCRETKNVDKNNDGKIEGSDEENLKCKELVDCTDSVNGEAICG